MRTGASPPLAIAGPRTGAGGVALVCAVAAWCGSSGCATTQPAVGRAPEVATEIDTRAPVERGRIEVTLEGLDPTRGAGPVYVALWNAPETFMKERAWLRSVRVALDDRDASIVFDALAPGEYAISAFHDTRSTGSLRRGAFGIPLDPWAISNGGASLLPPTWEKAVFTVDDATRVVRLDFAHREGRRP